MGNRTRKFLSFTLEKLAVSMIAIALILLFNGINALANAKGCGQLACTVVRGMLH